MAKPTQKEIRASLEQQLRDKGADVAHFRDLLDDYMYLCRQLRKMETAASKGLTIKVISASGKECDRENPAIKQAAAYTKEKRQLLQAMGLTTDNCRPTDTEGGDL